jgi:thiamine biosynthesis lipoprotein
MVLPVKLHSASFEAIGVTNQVTVVQQGALPRALEIARAELVALDDACSRFRADSELVGLNTTGSAIVSPLLLTAIEAALHAAELTDGLVDPTVGGPLRALGYDRDFALIVHRGCAARLERRPATGWRSVRVDRARSSVALARGTELDLGATAKALAADRIAAQALADTGSPVLVSLGGDITVAGEAPEGGWPVLVTDDSRGTSVDGQLVSIRDGALATSSTTVRRWRTSTGDAHHIVDPATGDPAPRAWRTVSATAASCVAANTATTAAIVLGERAPGWLAARGIAARLVREDDRVEYVGGWPRQPGIDPQDPLSRS